MGVKLAEGSSFTWVAILVYAHKGIFIIIINFAKTINNKTYIVSVGITKVEMQPNGDKWFNILSFINLKKNKKKTNSNKKNEIKKVDKRKV